MMSHAKFVGDVPFQGNQFAGCDFEKMWQEAKSRWLRPSEIYDILTNHSRFIISREPVNLPPSGTLVLFDRKMLRNFRRDGHPWRKKKDNKTVKEAHEHLKVGSEEKIHVYYAHGDGESNLQRRVYWLLDKTLEHIVLVHYLEVKEVVRTSTYNSHHPSPLQPIQTKPYNAYPASQEPMLSSDNSAGPSSAQRLEFCSNGEDDFDRFYLDDLQSTGETGFGNAPVESQWPNNVPADFMGQQMNIQRAGNLNGSALMLWDTTPHLPGATPKLSSHSNDGQPFHGMQAFIPQNNSQDTAIQRTPLDLQSPYASQAYAPESSSSLEISTQTDEMGGVTRERSDLRTTELSLSMRWLENGDEVLKKLDSLDRWMQRELPVENKTSPLAPSTNSCSVLDTSMGGEDKVMEDGGQLAWQSPKTDGMTPSFVPQLFFGITDYSPTWGLVSEDTKVLITGHFNGDAADFSNIHWHCMFGDELVSAEVVQLGVLRCRFPKSGAPGKVPFYISDDSRNVCSDIEHFDFIVGETQQVADSATDHEYEDLRLQQRLARLLLSSHSMTQSKEHSKALASAMPFAFTQLVATVEQEWLYLDKLLNEHPSHLSEPKELLLQMFFKCTMMDQISNGTKSWTSFDDTGQAALHLAAALGYDWVVPISKASVTSLDFRDKKGWTALHWAASFGRERMVAALLAAGAKAGLVSDPTPGNPSGCTAADVAAQAGYDGLAGYLSEQDLSSHLQVLTLEESDRDKQCAHEQGHRVVEYLRRSASLRRSVKTYEDELALEDSLSAIGNATTMSARIHAAFKEYFMRERLQAIEEADEYGFSVEEQLAVRKIQKAYRKHREQRMKENAALRIQNRFRVYKTRKNFMNFRQNVIKIQAYYRMHKARKEYKKILWSVGILEKALLRWRQKRKGLRGYQAEVRVYLEAKGADDFLEIGRKQAEDALDKAVLLVQSMVRSRLARQQYRRMKESFEQAKAAEYAARTWNQVLPDGDAGLPTPMFVTL